MFPQKIITYEYDIAMANEYYGKNPDGICSQCIKKVQEYPTDFELAKNRDTDLEIPFTLSPFDMH